MQTVKVRKVGNSRVLTIPAQIDTEATQYSVSVAEDGTITYQPLEPNPFKNADWIQSHATELTEFGEGDLEDEF
ncbi:antitoxin of toxin-antitoxin stability system [Weissella confusa]|uniref:Antitoxin of toxin-antitoxin stability system n=1 Tax=Weissella confusa TaxID=1583 RepID=A0AA41CW87_WEICO|nr:antitoxin of toxin-antitoxin stability system [Weissella confusa]MBJ7639814.1 antitoxin of toxin-antitoxin stability system [Weissella confusa]QYU58887.1 antitoxin of toxin-antitoxin stability system [Weissella confusa]